MKTRFVAQRADGDCGVAALATALRLPYEDVYAKVAHLDPQKRGRAGLHAYQIADAAKALGHAFRIRRRWQPEHHDGVLGIVKVSEPRKTGHWVALLDGVVLDPNGEIATYEDYFHESGWKPTCLITDD